VRLGEKQELFAHLLPDLIEEAHSLGFLVRLKELLRGEQQAWYNAHTCAVCDYNRNDHHPVPDPQHDFKPIGIVNSLHCVGLAIDLVLFRNNRPLWATKHYQELGEFWESLDPLCSWGGRFNDGGHFSIQHGGRR
jgi:hypothetical protein